jgi:hypothetical protein
MIFSTVSALENCAYGSLPKLNNSLKNKRIFSKNPHHTTWRADTHQSNTPNDQTSDFAVHLPYSSTSGALQQHKEGCQHVEVQRRQLKYR